MTFWEIALIGVGLAMDAFAVSVCKGLAMKKLDGKKAVIIGLYFGLFQAVMPVIGYLLGSAFSSLVQKIDHWIAFILLALIGINMIRESGDEENVNDSVAFRVMLVLAVATSIDALAVGVTFAFLSVRLIPAVSLIGIITFVLSILGVVLGHRAGGRLGPKAQVTGGVILILIGLKILLEHLGILTF